MTQKYKITYKFERGGVTKAELDARKDDELGACDAFLFCGVVEGPGGATNTLLVGADGRGEEATSMSADEIFKIWSLLAKRLADDPKLGEGRRRLCADVFEIIRDAVLTGRRPS